MVCRHSSTVSSAALFMTPKPALFTRTSGPPVSLSTHSNNAATSVLVLTSAAFPTTLRCDWLVRRLTASSTPLWLRPHIATVAPASAKARAIDNPMPRVAPVTTAVRPARNISLITSSYVAMRRIPARVYSPQIAENQVMRDAQPSRTAQRVAMRRAAHQLLDEPRVFDDPLAVAIADGESERPPRAEQPFSRALRAFLAVRSRYAEDQLAQAVERGIRQYVVLGAGLDTFAYRNPFQSAGLHVFEVDHPATQEWKRAQLRDAGIAIPEEMTFAAVDFERQSLEAGLLAAGFDQRQSAFFSWLGVTPYLSRPAFDATVEFIASLPAGSGVGFDFAIERSLITPLQQLAL